MNLHARSALWMFDLGNTSLKGRWSRDGQAGTSITLDWEAPGIAAALADALATWPAPARVLVACVAADSRAAHLREALQRWPGAIVEWLVTPRHACGITTSYRVPSRLGIDRFLAMAGARLASGGAPFVVVGCGTALTLDAVDAAGRQQQGLIAPSPDLMLRSLQLGTAIADTNGDAFAERTDAGGDDTRRAIHAGCRDAAVALVESFHARQRTTLDAGLLWLHGGGAAALKAALDEHDVVSACLLEDAVWRGLEAWASAAPAGVTRA